jgi:hypothetical protein
MGVDLRPSELLVRLGEVTCWASTVSSVARCDELEAARPGLVVAMFQPVIGDQLVDRPAVELVG